MDAPTDSRSSRVIGMGGNPQAVANVFQVFHKLAWLAWLELA